MVFDPDLTPEGGAIQASYKINDANSLAFNGAAFVLMIVRHRPRPFIFVWRADNVECKMEFKDCKLARGLPCFRHCQSAETSTT